MYKLLLSFLVPAPFAAGAEITSGGSGFNPEKGYADSRLPGQVL